MASATVEIRTNEETISKTITNRDWIDAACAVASMIACIEAYDAMLKAAGASYSFKEHFMEAAKARFVNNDR